jgi:hypothetical protein
MASLKIGEFYRLRVDRPGKDQKATTDLLIPKGTVVKVVRLYTTSVVVMDKDNNWTSFQKGYWMSYLQAVPPHEALKLKADE